MRIGMGDSEDTTFARIIRELTGEAGQTNLKNTKELGRLNRDEGVIPPWITEITRGDPGQFSRPIANVPARPKQNMMGGFTPKQDMQMPAMMGRGMGPPPQGMPPPVSGMPSPTGMPPMMGMAKQMGMQPQQPPQMPQAQGGFDIMSIIKAIMSGRGQGMM